MKTSKRFLTLLLTLVMLVGVFTVAVAAAEPTATLTISYKSNWPAEVNQTVDSAGQTVASGVTANLKGGWTLEGYTMKGWATSPDGDVAYAPGAEYTFNGTEDETLTLYSVWEKVAPPIGGEENNQGGTTTPPTTGDYKLTITYSIYGDVYDWGYTPKYENWCDGDHFFGWCDTPWFDSSWDHDPRACNDHYSYQSTCYFCNSNKQVSHKPSYSKPSSSKDTSPKFNGAGYYDEGVKASISASSSFNYRGVKYSFVCWSGKGVFGDRDDRTTTFAMPAADTTIYAIYAPAGSYNGYYGSYCNSKHTHTVTYTDGVPGRTIFKDVVKSVRHNGTTPTIKDPTRPGYRFDGWSPKVSKTTTKCTVYEARWTKAVAPGLTDECVAYLKGYGKGQFRPDNNMTRGEFAVLLYRLLDDATLKAYKTTENTFSDVNSSDWYNEAISTLANAGVIEAAKSFDPKDNITRAEMVAMLAAFYAEDGYDYYDEICTCKYSCNHKKYSYSNKYTPKYATTYKDVPSTYWAYDQISLAQKLGWVKGYGGNTFLPDATITRAEVAAIINRVLDRDCDVKDTKNYTDVAKDAWYYADVLEATIAH